MNRLLIAAADWSETCCAVIDVTSASNGFTCSGGRKPASARARRAIVGSAAAHAAKLHDRFAGSAIVQPIGRDGPVVPCLILLVLLVVVLPFIFVLGLIAMGTQLTEILSEVGTSI